MTDADPRASVRPSLRRSRKQRPGIEWLCELVFRPVAQFVVLVLLPLRVPPPAVVLASAATGVAAAVELARGSLTVAAALVLVKTVLDNADGQLARASGRVTVLGRYLDSESDLLVDAALLAGLAYATGRHVTALASFLVLTLVLGVDFNLDRLYRVERGERFEASPAPTGRAEVALARVYALVYAPQDRLVEGFVAWRLRRLRADPAARLRYHDRASLQLVANFGLSTQMAALAACLLLGRPSAYLWLTLACGAALLPLEARREWLARPRRR